MGLYLCVFDGDEEVEGVEIGSYADFNFFRETIIATVENGRAGSRCPTLIAHHDSDGEWLAGDAANLLNELELVEKTLKDYPPVEFNSPWKSSLAKKFGMEPGTLLDCFFDVDGEPLINRLKVLAGESVQRGLPILFQ